MVAMKIEILCGSGSPDGVTPSDIYGMNGRPGVGGAELGLLTMCEGWHKEGHEVILYNNPKRQDAPFAQRPVMDFDMAHHGEVVIFFREPTQRVMQVKNSLKIFWSCDQYTVGDFAHFSTFVDKVVTISPCHSRYFKEHYQIENSIAIDLPVRTWDYEQVVEKVPNRLIFTSVPDRGLDVLAEIYPQIKERVPDVSLVVTSDYRLWGAADPCNNRFAQMFLRADGVQFLGAVPRKRLIEEQLKAQIHLYPCVYQELFCIAVAESQVAGAFPITSSMGALETTNMGTLLGEAINKQDFIESAADALNCPVGLAEMQASVKKKAIERFSLPNILKQWQEKVFNL